MIEKPVNSRYFRIISRFTLLFAILLLGERGIFSEENNTPSSLLGSPVQASNLHFTQITFESFHVFMLNNFYKEHYPFLSHHKSSKLPLKERKIMGSGRSSVNMLAEFLEQHNRKISKAKAFEIAHIYVQEANKEGVNYDVAFSQMCLETGFLKYGGDVRPQQNNFCGLGVVTKGTHGLSFSSIRMGIRAHIQHLKAYASNAKIKSPIVDKRFKYVKRGSIKTINDLSGRWASDKHYSHKIYSLLTRLYQERRN
jgi:hypothetical protein